MNSEMQASNGPGIISFRVSPLVLEAEWNGGKALLKGGRDEVATSSNGLFPGHDLSSTDLQDALPDEDLLGAAMLQFPENLPDVSLGDFYAI